MITYHEAQTLMANAQNRGSGKRRKIGNNTYLYEGNGTDYCIRLHATDIITIHADGTFTLNSGGWTTVTTQSRFRDLGPARVHSYGKYGWCIFGKNDPKTPPKVQKCRTCHGNGRVFVQGWIRTQGYVDNRWTQFDTPEVIPDRWVECWNCTGTGKCDYGSKPRPVRFYDGINVDSWGECTDPTAERAYETDEERAARDEAAAKTYKERHKIKRQEFMRSYGLTPKRGKLIVFKAVDDELYSGHGFQYPIGETVTDPSWRPTEQCGNGLHFGPTPRDAESYFTSATRFLACEVKVSEMIPLDDKIKVKSARVLYECDMTGNPLNI